MTVYLNTYKTWQAYGGPEEGGWWYECGEPVQSIKISDEDYEEYNERCDADESGRLWEERRELCDKATLGFTNGNAPTPVKNGLGGYTFVVGSDIPSSYSEDNSFSSCIEDSIAQFYPHERPHYE